MGTMKTAFQISVLANVLLGALVCYQAAHPRAERAATAAVSTAVQRASLPPRGSPAQTGPVASRGFDWRQQVESAEYPTYIANLRAIHCPEQTVRDIIKADVAGLFAQKRRQLSGSVVSGRWSPEAEARLFAVLFGDQVPQTISASSADSAAQAVVTPVKLPLILQTQALATLKLTDEQREELKELSQEFIQEIGGMQQDPHDPGYLEKWQKAQPKFDELIVRAIGRRALVDLDEAIPAPDSGNQ